MILLYCNFTYGSFNIIIRVESKEQFDIRLNIIHKSFQTVADEMNLTKDNCPSYTAFMPIEKLISQFENNTPMLLYQYNGCFAGYFLCQLMMIALN